MELTATFSALCLAVALKTKHLESAYKLAFTLPTYLSVSWFLYELNGLANDSCGAANFKISRLKENVGLLSLITKAQTRIGTWNIMVRTKSFFLNFR